MSTNPANIETEHVNSGESEAQSGQPNPTEAQQKVNSLLTQLQTTNDPQEAKELAAQLSEQVAQLPS